MSEPTPNITKIPAPRVPILDQRTNLISREWFRFFNNIYTLVGGENQGVVQITSGGTGASTAAQARANLGAGTVTRVRGNGTVSGLTLTGDITDDGVLTLGGQIEISFAQNIQGVLNLTTQTTGTIDAQTQIRNAVPLANGGSGISVTGIRTITSDSSLTDTDKWVINNKSGSSCTVTLPAASSWGGRSIVFKNLQAQTLVSASSNVVPINSGSAGNSILPATVGAWATLVSDGANWVVMQS
jgi:hypothetical protein